MRNLVILVVGLAILATTPAMAQDINNVKEGAAYKGFLKYAKQCKSDGTCSVDKVAKMANLRKGAVVRACNSEFGASAAGPCIAALLGSWKDITFKVAVAVAATDPCTPNPCKKGQNCNNVDGQAVCEDAVVVAVADPVKPKRPKKPRVRKGKVKPPVVVPPIVVTEVVEVEAIDGLSCINGCRCIGDEEAEEGKIPWAAIVLIPLMWILLTILILWILRVVLRKEDDDEPPAPPSGGIGEDDVTAIVSAVSANANQEFSERLKVPLQKLIKFVVSNLGDDDEKVAEALKQGISDLLKSFEAEAEAAAEPTEEEEEESIDEIETK